MQDTYSLWLVVDLNNNELPLFVGDSVREVADYANTTTNAVMSGIAHAKERGGRCRFVHVVLSKKDDLYKEMMQDTLVGIEQISEYLGVNRKTFKRYQSLIPHYKVGRKFYADKKAIEQWFSKQGVPWNEKKVKKERKVEL